MGQRGAKLRRDDIIATEQDDLPSFRGQPYVVDGQGCTLRKRCSLSQIDERPAGSYEYYTIIFTTAYREVAGAEAQQNAP